MLSVEPEVRLVQIAKFYWSRYLSFASKARGPRGSFPTNTVPEHTAVKNSCQISRSWRGHESGLMTAGSTPPVHRAQSHWVWLCGGGALAFQRPQAARVKTSTSQTDRLEDRLFSLLLSYIERVICFLRGGTQTVACSTFLLLPLLKLKPYCSAFACADLFKTQLLSQRMGCVYRVWAMLFLRRFVSVSRGKN